MTTVTHARTRYSTVAIALHWLIAAAIIFQFIIGTQMERRSGLAAFQIFQLHKSIGFTILFLSLIRLAWRLVNPPPALPGHMKVWEKGLAHLTHFGLYLAMIGLPLTGWVMISTSRINVPTLLYKTVPFPHLPGLPELPKAVKELWYNAGDVGHHLLILLLLVLFALHVLGALKHHILDKDEVLGHMAPGVKPGFWFEPRLWGAAVVAVALIVIGVLSYGGPKPEAKTAAAAVATPLEPGIVATPDAASPPGTAPTEPAAATAAAAPEAAGPATPPAVWRVNSGGSLGFTASWGGDPIKGTFKTWTADILFSPDSLDASKLKVNINVASASTGDEQRDSSLPGEDWFDSAKHPTAVFTSDKIRKVSDDRYEAKGKLNLRGKSVPVTVPFTLKITGDAAKVTGGATLDRTAFGVGQGEWAATDQIAAKVDVAFNFTAKRQ